jgi:phenylpropionate dioxygenase-like ring-hydroxylating dioxygenase large terminal subunit
VAQYLHAYENLVEATHISYLHHGFVDTGNAAAHPFKEEVAEDRITTVREFRDEPVFPYAKMSYGLRSDTVDRELRLIAMPPSVTVVSEGYKCDDHRCRVQVYIRPRCADRSLRALMDSADPHLSSKASSKPCPLIRFGGSRSDLFAITLSTILLNL